jgi:hypothetical protein
LGEGCGAERGEGQRCHYIALQEKAEMVMFTKKRHRNVMRDRTLLKKGSPAPTPKTVKKYASVTLSFLLKEAAPE